MGGLICQIRRNAVLRFEAVPSRPSQVKQFDAQMRELLTAPGIAEAVAEDEPRGHEVCAILGKERWSQQDREKLFAVVEELYGE
jgi:hypothetical protein